MTDRAKLRWKRTGQIVGTFILAAVAALTQGGVIPPLVGGPRTAESSAIVDQAVRTADAHTAALIEHHAETTDKRLDVLTAEMRDMNRQIGELVGEARARWRTAP